jgi:heme-degrading monooxygenase HmoA
MPSFVTHLTVDDFDAFCRAFAEGASARKANGSRGARLFRSERNSNQVIAFFEWDDLEKSRQFLHSPELRERLKLAGVLSQPERYEEGGAFLA